jgi:hypothetical protein
VHRAAVVCVFLVCAAAATAKTSPQVQQTAKTKTYALTLTVGPSEAMYTAAQVQAKHLKEGEVTVGSSMSMGGGHAMSMEGGMTRHLEVHVRLRSNRKVVTDVVPAIMLVDESSKAMTSSPLQVMAMKGIGEGISDLHYGNNVALVRSHRYTVLVTLKGERAQFAFRAA